jgi:hypothetical protein
VTGTFANLAVTGIFGSTQPTVRYDANDAFLVLAPAVLASRLPPGSPTNATNVANAIDAANSGTMNYGGHLLGAELAQRFTALSHYPPNSIQGEIAPFSQPHHHHPCSLHPPQSVDYGDLI